MENNRPILKKGDRVALIAPSSAIPDGKIADCERICRELGLEPVAYESATSRRKYLSGTDELRAHDINAAFADDSINGIWAVRGGYGACRILPMMDFDMIAKHPKFFGGYSDITAFHVAIDKLCGFPTYHAIMPSSDKITEEYSLRSLKAAMFGTEQDYANPANVVRGSINGGKAAGRLMGGNLSLLVAALGSKWELDARGKLLFIEEIGEKPYRVDSFLTSLRNAGKFDECAGIIFGQFTDCEAEKPDESLSVDEVIREIVAPCGKPIITNVQCGHISPSLSLPLGVEFVMDADAMTFGEK